VLLTGQHLGHAEIRGNQQAKVKLKQFNEGQHPISAEVVTLPQRFREAGFITGAFGKWGLGPVGSTGDPNRKGLDQFFGYNCQAVAHSYFPPALWSNDRSVPLNDKPIPGHVKQPSGDVSVAKYQGTDYAPARMIAEAEAFIHESAGKPFFLYLPFIEPHVALQPPPKLLELFPQDWDQEPYRGEKGYTPHPRPRAAYAALIHDLDRHVGRILKALEETGLADDTLVIFTSDNGATFDVGGVDTNFFNSTAGLRGRKGTVYEGGAPRSLDCPLARRHPAWDYERPC
jgi:arylsulfatase A-like enzyme